MHIPHEALKIDWYPDGLSFKLTLPWVEMDIDVNPDEKEEWIADAVTHLHQDPTRSSVQRFMTTLKNYPLGYLAPRSWAEFEGQDLQASTPTLDGLETETPRVFLQTIGAPYSPQLEEDCPPKWVWDPEVILRQSQIPGTTFYDPMSVVTSLICYRLNWESTSWSGEDGLGQGLERILKEDETLFFQKMGWISRQSHYVTKQFHLAVLPALTHFKKAEKEIQHFIQDEVGHFKFMEQTLEDLGFKGAGDFPVGDANRWTLDAFERMGTLSPLAFSAMINLFEAAYYEGQDPLSRVLKLSSRPEAARGYDLHYKINQEHRHCDMPIIFSKRIAPVTRDHVVLATRLFELALSFLDRMEERLLMPTEASSAPKTQKVA